MNREEAKDKFGYHYRIISGKDFYRHGSYRARKYIVKEVLGLGDFYYSDILFPPDNLIEGLEERISIVKMNLEMIIDRLSLNDIFSLHWLFNTNHYKENEKSKKVFESYLTNIEELGVNSSIFEYQYLPEDINIEPHLELGTKVYVTNHHNKLEIVESKVVDYSIYQETDDHYIVYNELDYKVYNELDYKHHPGSSARFVRYPFNKPGKTYTRGAYTFTSKKLAENYLKRVAKRRYKEIEDWL